MIHFDESRMEDMNTFMCHCILHLLVIILFIQTASCLNCYECFSTVSGNCGRDFQHNKIPTKSCNFSDTICYKETKTFKGIPVVLRDCGTFETCDNLIRNCYFCKGDLCNGSSNPFNILPLITVSLILLNVNKIIGYYTF